MTATVAPAQATPKNHAFKTRDMKHLIFITHVLLFCVTAYAKPHCQGFNNYDDRVTIVFTVNPEGYFRI